MFYNKFKRGLSTVPRFFQHAKRFFRSNLVEKTNCKQFNKNNLTNTYTESKFVNVKRPIIKVAVTGAAGAIGYSLLFRMASGEIFGKNQKLEIKCIELPQAMNKLKGVAMEIQDCAFPLLNNVICTDNLEQGFEDVDVALLVGSRPRTAGIERADLLRINGEIFTKIGKALNKWAHPNVKVTVVGNPANTNCLIASANAPDLPSKNFSAMTRLDHDRGLGELARKSKVSTQSIKGFTVWGNHSPTMYPDITNTTSNGVSIMNILKSANPDSNIQQWYKDKFIPTIQQRGTAIIKARGAPSAASACNACINHTRDWVMGTSGNIVSMAVHCDGEYGITKGLFFSFPVVCHNSSYEILDNLSVNKYSRKKIKITEQDLIEERDAVKDYLP